MAFLIIVINLIFFLLLAFGMYLGFKRGLKHSALHFAFVFVSIIFALIISTPIAKAILNTVVQIENGQSITLAEKIAANKFKFALKFALRIK